MLKQQPGNKSNAGSATEPFPNEPRGVSFGEVELLSTTLKYQPSHGPRQCSPKQLASPRLVHSPCAATYPLSNFTGRNWTRVAVGDFGTHSDGRTSIVRRADNSESHTTASGDEVPLSELLQNLRSRRPEICT